MRRAENVIKTELDYLSRSPFSGLRIKQAFFQDGSAFSDNRDIAKTILKCGWSAWLTSEASEVMPYINHQILSVFSLHVFIFCLSDDSLLIKRSVSNVDEAVGVLSICLFRLMKPLCEAPLELLVTKISNFEYQLLLSIIEEVGYSNQNKEKSQLDDCVEKIFG